MTPHDSSACIKFWCTKLGLKDDILTVEIHPDQVFDDGNIGCADFVGVNIEARVIYHSRPLTEQDIVHELLHVLRPDWSEENVREETDRQLV